MNVIKTAILASLGLFASVSHADTLLGIYASADYWYVQGNGKDAKVTASKQDLDKKGQVQLAVSFEHPVPLLPNARLRYTSLSVDSQNQILNTPVAHLNLDNTDFILYYELLDNVVSADVGIAAKRLSGDIGVVGGLAKQDIRETLPSLYASVGAKLPFTGLSAKAEAMYGQNSDNKATDFSAELKYDFVKNALVDVGGKLGYRFLNVDLKPSQTVEPQLRLNGPYVGVEVHF